MEPEAKKRRVEKEIPRKKTEWFDLPYDVRYIIIGKMDRKTKLCYLLSSDDCAADMPKNLFKRVVASRTCLTVWFNDASQSKEDIHFQDFGHKNVMVSIRTIRNRDAWRIREKKSLYEVLAKYFQRIIRKLNKLDVLLIQGYFPFKTTSIKNLLEIGMLQIVVGFQLLEKKHHIDLVQCGFINSEQLSIIRNKIHLSNIDLKLSQLTQMNAKIMDITSKGLSARDFNQYLKSFINGQLHENLQSITLKFTNRLRDYDLFNTVIKGLDIIKKSEDERARASLTEYQLYLLPIDEDETSFAVISNEKDKRIAVVRYSYINESFDIRFWSKLNLYDHKAPDYKDDFFVDNFQFKIVEVLKRD